MSNGKVATSKTLKAKLYSASAMFEARIPRNIQSNRAIADVKITTPACGKDSFKRSRYFFLFHFIEKGIFNKYLVIKKLVNISINES